MASRKPLFSGDELTPFDELFMNNEERADLKREKIVNLPIADIHDFPDHPYHVRDDDSMMELVESIQKYGLLQPVLVRPIEGGKYEMVSGHRRKRAFELAGIAEIPSRIVELSRDDAAIMMVDSNLQRDEILPSEKAFAYKIKLEALSRQGQRTDLTSSPVGTKLEETCTPVGHKLKSVQLLAENSPDGKTQIQRFIRLTELIPVLLQMVDDKKIALRPAVEISYLPKEKQEWLADAIELTDCTPSHAQTRKMRSFESQGKLTREVIDSIMDEEKPNQRQKPAFTDHRITKLIPQSVPAESQVDYVVKALEYYAKHKQRSNDAR